MGTTNFDIVSTSAVQVSGTNIITAQGSAPAFSGNDAANISSRLNALVSTLTNIGIIA